MALLMTDRSSCGRIGNDMTTFLYRCATTGAYVQGWVADDPKRDKASYEAVTCIACGRVHFVNPITGKTVFDKEKNSK